MISTSDSNHKRKSRLAWLPLLLVLLTAIQAGARAATPPQTGCEIDRVLKLAHPYIKGADVLELQTRLHTLGYYNHLIDGVYGPATEAAVIAFQRSEQADPTGLVTASTWARLAEGVALPTAAPPARPPGKVSLIIDTGKLQLIVLSDGKPYKTFPVAIGRGGQLRTPVGNFKIIRKDKGWGGGFGSRWLGLNVPEGIYGIHGTNKPWSIGTRASHGCIRMFNRNVETLYEWVSIGTPVTITGPLANVPLPAEMHEGMSGPGVRNVQLRLQELGFDPHGADGRFGPETTTAVKRLQQLYGLPVDGRVSTDVYFVLGFDGR